jgi:hypothetical protein
MKKLVLILAAGLFLTACNNSGTETTTSDSTTIKDNTNTSTGEPTYRTDTLNKDTLNKRDSINNEKFCVHIINRNFPCRLQQQ